MWRQSGGGGPEKLKNKTCGCSEDAACIEEAKTMAAEWVEKHKDATGGDQENAEQLMNEIVECNLSVALEISKAAK